ncbi:MAG: class I SAM-dependent methyltransferase [Candidatus Taylorbacteria bacterium]|nr:class I SAM-dependent methyltransferase [Candidatus Taylorbacteria bacterium]
MFSDPQKILDQFKLNTGRTVADLGSGGGYYAIPAAKMVGPMGRVYAIDVLKDMLQKVKNEAIRNQLYNVEALWGNAEKLGGTRLADATVDIALICNSLFLIEDKNTFIQEVKRILRPEGRVLLVDWKDSYGGIGPQPSHIVLPKIARELFEKAGFEFDRELKDAGEHHYGIILRRV